MQEETDQVQRDEEIASWFTLWDDSVWDIDWSQQWNVFIAAYGAPLTRYIISFIYYVYIRCTLINVGIFLLKYVPTFVYIYKLTKNVYVSSREKIKEKQMELEDIKLQIQIVSNKLCVRDAEIAERTQELRRATERLRYVRARVRDVIASDASLRHMAEMASRSPVDVHDSTTSNSEDEYIGELLTELKCSYVARTSDPLDYPDNSASQDAVPDDSVCSTLTDDSKRNCRVKIVKVTNVYKVAYLRNYIKQKRLRRASRHALLKKKVRFLNWQMESIKKLLETWQNTLNTVINSKLSILNMDPRNYELVPQEAMGDYSKPNVGSDDDSVEMSNDYDDCGINWARNYQCNYDDYPETAHSGDFTEPPDLMDMKYGGSMHIQCECNKLGSKVLFILPEETSSQVAIEEIVGDQISCEPDPLECQDSIRCET